MNNILEKRINNIRAAKGSARLQELKYLGYQMKELGQEKLIGMIDDLKYSDLKLLFAAGIPGSAYAHTLQRYYSLKKEIEEFGSKLR